VTGTLTITLFLGSVEWCSWLPRQAIRAILGSTTARITFSAANVLALSLSPASTLPCCSPCGLQKGCGQKAAAALVGRSANKEEERKFLDGLVDTDEEREDKKTVEEEGYDGGARALPADDDNCV
jgi:hypothetical protein